MTIFIIVASGIVGFGAGAVFGNSTTDMVVGTMLGLVCGILAVALGELVDHWSKTH